MKQKWRVKKGKCEQCGEWEHLKERGRGGDSLTENVSETERKT